MGVIKIKKTLTSCIDQLYNKAIAETTFRKNRRIRMIPQAAEMGADGEISDNLFEINC